MPVSILIPKYKRNPNAKVESLYVGVAPGGRTMTSVVKADATGQRLETTRTYGPGLPRGQGGRIGVLVLGGMETTLAEMEYIAECVKEKRFTPRRTGGQVADMCRALMERRNAAIRYYRANPSEAPRPKKRTVRLHLPVGYRYVNTSEPGLKVLARV